MFNHHILITGASGKIGITLLKHFISKGIKVVAISSSNIGKEKLISTFNSEYKSGLLELIVQDLIAKDASSVIVDKLQKLNINPHYFIHSARNLSNLAVGENGLTNKDNFISEFNLGIVSPYEITLKLSKMINSNLSSVVYLSSIYGVVPFNPNLYDNPEQEAPIQYSIVKASQIHLMKEMSIRLAPKIRVNCVSFGGVEGRVNQAFMERYKKLCPLSKMLQSNDVIGPIDFLLDNHKSSSITGHNLIVDGGWTVW